MEGNKAVQKSSKSSLPLFPGILKGEERTQNYFNELSIFK
jgi:hypothetical protein